MITVQITVTGTDALEINKRALELRDALRMLAWNYEINLLPTGCIALHEPDTLVECVVHPKLMEKTNGSSDTV